jgi:hypothetical protein
VKGVASVCPTRPTLGLGALLSLVLAGCGSSGSSNSGPVQINPPNNEPTAASQFVPAEFRPGCNHPGVTITLVKTRLPVTISHAACDLRGVIIRWHSGTDQVPGVVIKTVPTTCNEHSGAGKTGCPSISVAMPSGDVTIRRLT